VPLCSTTVAVISAVPLTGKIRRFVTRVMVDCVGASRGTLSQAETPRKAIKKHSVAHRGGRGHSRGIMNKSVNDNIDMDLHGQHHAQREAGYAMAALLIAIAVMHILMSAAMPVWRHATRRELEAELVFRGEQYARAIGLYQRKFAATFPPNLDALIDQRFLRRKYKDPLTEDGEFQILYQGSQAQFGAGSATTARPGQPTTPVSGAGQQPPAPAQQLQSAAEKLRTAQAGAIIGVVSKSKETSIALYNGRNK